jgi:hypothetical protein
MTLRKKILARHFSLTSKRLSFGTGDKLFWLLHMLCQDEGDNGSDLSEATHKTRPVGVLHKKDSFLSYFYKERYKIQKIRVLLEKQVII